MKHNIVPINKAQIPYYFDILLAGETFTIRVDYNSTADFFTLSLLKKGILICAGEPLIFGVPLFKDIYKAGKYPAINIVPTDESGENNRVTFDNLGKTVYLAIYDGVEDE